MSALEPTMSADLAATITITCSDVKIDGEIPSIFDTWLGQLAASIGANLVAAAPGGMTAWLLASPNLRTPPGCGAVIRLAPDGSMDVRLFVDGDAASRGIPWLCKVAPMASMLAPMAKGMIQ